MDLREFLENAREIFSDPSVSRVKKELMARGYRELQPLFRDKPDCADLDRQIEELFTEHGV